ncbi:transposase family protein [Streptomyces vinaceus]
MPCLAKSLTPAQRSLPDLAAGLAVLPGSRDRRGRRHTLVSVLLTACAAVLAGAKSFTALGQWAAVAPQDALARFGARTATASSIRTPPSTATLRCVFSGVCPGGLADLPGAAPAGTTTVAVAGTPAREPRGGSRLSSGSWPTVTGSATD